MVSHYSEEIEWVREEDVDEIIALFSLVFDRTMMPAYYRWQFFRNELGGYRSVVLRVGGTIVSHAGYSPRDWMINGSRGLIMAKHTSMTHPDYQGSGLYAKVLQWSRDRFADMGVDLILSWPNRNSHPMQRNRSTYEDIYQIPTMKLSCPTCSRAQLIEIPFSETRSIDFQTWRDIAAETTSKSLFANIRTADYLSWRFKERPDVQYYFIEYREAGKLRSALIFKLFPSNEPQVVNVVEWLCEPECPEGGHVLEDLKEWAFSHGLPITIWHNVHDYPRHHLLERNGYVPSEPIFYFGAIPVGSQDRLGPFRDWRTWYMSMGDVDVF